VACICAQSQVHSLRVGTPDLSFKDMTRPRGFSKPKAHLAPEHRGPRTHHLRGIGRNGHRAGPGVAVQGLP
jgi:hypothetical protein